MQPSKALSIKVSLSCCQWQPGPEKAGRKKYGSASSGIGPPSGNSAGKWSNTGLILDQTALRMETIFVSDGLKDQRSG